MMFLHCKVFFNPNGVYLDVFILICHLFKTHLSILLLIRSFIFTIILSIFDQYIWHIVVLKMILMMFFCFQSQFECWERTLYKSLFFVLK